MRLLRRRIEFDAELILGRRIGLNADDGDVVFSGNVVRRRPLRSFVGDAHVLERLARDQGQQYAGRPVLVMVDTFGESPSLNDIVYDVIYDIMLAVIDANVLLRAFRSRNGASHAIVRNILLGDQECAASPAIILEYEDVLKRPGILGSEPGIPADEIDKVLDAICARAVHVVPWFRFRPFLNDPKDDMYVECALASGARIIVTDDRHFRHPAVPAFGVTAMTAGEFLSYQRSRND